MISEASVSCLSVSALKEGWTEQFLVRFLGSVPVPIHKGNSVLCAAMQKVGTSWTFQPRPALIQTSCPAAGGGIDQEVRDVLVGTGTCEELYPLRTLMGLVRGEYRSPSRGRKQGRWSSLESPWTLSVSVEAKSAVTPCTRQNQPGAKLQPSKSSLERLEALALACEEMFFGAQRASQRCS